MGLREFNLTSIIPGVNAWASEKGRTILLDETTTNQNCSRLFPQGLKEVLHRSEEHTSELQSQSNLVCRLLLEKKFRPSRSTLIRVAASKMSCRLCEISTTASPCSARRRTRSSTCRVCATPRAAVGSSIMTTRE